MNSTEHISYWLASAAHDLESAETLFQNQRFDWCLFLGHLVIEKTIKAFFVRENPDEPVPQIHNLSKLVERTKLQLTAEQRTFIAEITQFNIKARYPDYKFEFYQKCTREFTQEYFTKIKELYQWLSQQM
jgi:HEPN domain-containing protein